MRDGGGLFGKVELPDGLDEIVRGPDIDVGVVRKQHRLHGQAFFQGSLQNDPHRKIASWVVDPAG